MASICNYKMLKLLLLASLFSFSASLAVFSIDFGCEWIKMALVKPGTPMETVLMPDSSRKLNNLIGFKKDEILIGDPAIIYCQKKPKEVYPYVREVLAKYLYSHELEDYRHRFPQVEMGSLSDRDGFAFIHNNETFLPEELIAMIFDQSQEIASKFAEQPVSGVVITIPPYFTQAERRAIEQAANISNLKLLQIMNDNTAVALNYGLFRQKMFNNTPHYVMFYDMGACSSQVTIVAYQNVQIKETTLVTYPQLTIKTFGFDRTLGGSAFQIRLRDHLASAFNQEKHSTTSDVTMDPRAMNKIYVEAGRVMKILSANSEAYAQVENLLEGLNMKIKITRTDFETICEDLFERVRGPIDDALNALSHEQIDKSEIEQIILFGAATRMPKIQDVLKSYSPNTDLGKGINTDEAAALGAVYQAAYLSQGFRAKKFIIKDANAYPIKVEFDKDSEPGAGDIDSNEINGATKTPTKKHISKLLFTRFNPCPQKKVITFNKNFDDFVFNVTYGDLSYLSPAELKNFKTLNISQVTVKGVAASFAKHSLDPETEFKGIKAHFTLDESCMLRLDHVDIHYEHHGPKLEESTFSKIGTKIKNFFTSAKGEDPDAQNPANEEQSIPANDITDNEVDADKTKGENGQHDDLKGEPDNSENMQNSTENTHQKTDSQKILNSTEANSTNEESANASYPIKEPLEFIVKRLDFLPIPAPEIKKCRKRLASYKEKEMKRKKLEEACNALESTLIETREKIEADESFKAFASEQELQDLGSTLTQVSEWFEENGHTASKDEVNAKLKELKKLIKPIKERAVEQDERGIAVDAMNQLLNYSHNFLESAKNLTATSLPIFTEVELNTLEKLIVTTQEWFEKKMSEQAGKAKNEDPALKRVELVEKIKDLEREVKYLQNKGQAEAMNQAKKFKAQMEAAEAEKAKKNESKLETENAENTTETEVPAKKEDSTTTADKEKKKSKTKKGKKKKDVPKEKATRFNRDVIDEDLGYNDVHKKTETTESSDKHPADEL